VLYWLAPVLLLACLVDQWSHATTCTILYNHRSRVHVTCQLFFYAFIPRNLEMSLTLP
jgi:hypothetical protein